jgi:hypothetical protein
LFPVIQHLLDLFFPEKHSTMNGAARENGNATMRRAGWVLALLCLGFCGGCADPDDGRMHHSSIPAFLKPDTDAEDRRFYHDVFFGN